MQLFGQHHELTPLENCKVCLKKLIFCLEHHETLNGPFWSKNTEKEKISNFGPKPWTNPLAKMKILPLL